MAENSIESNESQNVPVAVPTIPDGDYITNVKACKNGGYEIRLTPAPLTHPDVFTAEEAWRYLKFPCRESFNRCCREQHVKPLRAGRARLYAREQLDLLRRGIFGMDYPSRGRK